MLKIIDSTVSKNYFFYTKFATAKIVGRLSVAEWFKPLMPVRTSQSQKFQYTSWGIDVDREFESLTNLAFTDSA